MKKINKSIIFWVFSMIMLIVLLFFDIISKTIIYSVMVSITMVSIAIIIAVKNTEKDKKKK